MQNTSSKSKGLAFSLSCIKVQYYKQNVLEVSKVKVFVLQKNDPCEFCDILISTDASIHMKHFTVVAGCCSYFNDFIYSVVVKSSVSQHTDWAPSKGSQDAFEGL